MHHGCNDSCGDFGNKVILCHKLVIWGQSMPHRLRLPRRDVPGPMGAILLEVAADFAINANRVLAPMKRTNPKKGRNEDPGFVEISWDEAMSAIADKLNAIRAEGLLDASGSPGSRASRCITAVAFRWRPSACSVTR